MHEHAFHRKQKHCQRQMHKGQTFYFKISDDERNNINTINKLKA